jgi:hypothetical protein
MPLSKKKLPKPLTIRKATKLRNTPQKPDVPEMKECPLNIYVMAVANLCLKYMRKLGVSEKVVIHLSKNNDEESAIIRFTKTNEMYTRKNGKWIKLKED